MAWVEVLAVFVVSHVVGDYLLQTDWQALHKRGGLTGTPEMRRALRAHVTTYGLAFVPAMVWLWSRHHAWVFGIEALIVVPHLIQDDGRLLAIYAREVKGADLSRNPSLGAYVDQSFHLLALFLTALLAGT